MSFVLCAPALGATSRPISLVSPADAAAQLGAVNILGARPGEFPSKAPGPITGHETVHVSLAPDGRVETVIVDQDLVVHGVGDFSIETSGPALKVEAPIGSRTQPGLRRGSVIWEGFSPGERELRANVTLDTTGLRFLALPLRIAIAGNTLTIENQTVATRPIDVGIPEAAALADAMDAMRAELLAGRAPVAGTHGIPLTIASRSPVQIIGVDVRLPFLVSANLDSADGTPAHASAVVDARPLVTNFETPQHGFGIEAQPALPEPDALTPPRNARSWRAALTNANDATLRDALVQAQTVLWQVQRRQEYEAYLGNPLGGTSTATYVFAPAFAAVPVKPARPRERPKPLPIAIALLGVIALSTYATRWWLHN